MTFDNEILATYNLLSSWTLSAVPPHGHTKALNLTEFLKTQFVVALSGAGLSKKFSNSVPVKKSQSQISRQNTTSPW